MKGRAVRILLGAAAVSAAAAVAFGAFASSDDAEAIARVGLSSKGVPACESCHGPQGQGVDAQGGPRLAHLDEGYLERQLTAFALGERHNGVMEPIAQHLTPPQRAALAAYFASLPPPARQPGPADNARLALGRNLALNGDWSRKAPPCDACHGPGGGGVGSVTPPLVGQSQDYLFRQLTAFRDGDRSGPLGLMAGIARRLPDRDLRAAAAYYASLPFAAAPSANPRRQP
jgi:cytochrome c553